MSLLINHGMECFFASLTVFTICCFSSARIHSAAGRCAQEIVSEWRDTRPATHYSYRHYVKWRLCKISLEIRCVPKLNAKRKPADYFLSDRCRINQLLRIYLLNCLENQTIWIVRQCSLLFLMQVHQSCCFYYFSLDIIFVYQICNLPILQRLSCISSR